MATLVTMLARASRFHFLRQLLAIGDLLMAA
jgi:hypothetical protein